MMPFINILGIQLPMYGIMAIVGFGISLIVAMKIADIYKLPKQDLLFAGIYMIIGILVGSKLFYFLTFVPKIISNFDLVLEHPWAILIISFSGFVFYGGLIGGGLAVYLYAKHYKLEPLIFANVIAPVIPLFHGIGRIGCFLGGCCYGKEYHGIFAIRFPYNELVPSLNEVERFPVQLLESGLNFILCICLLFYSRKVRKPGSVLGIYLICYTIIRTITEYFRGDIVRGVYFLGISTSQIISFLLLPLGIWLCIRKSKKKV